jgi:quercetin dioxygenase-like cupin family protein
MHLTPVDTTASAESQAAFRAELLAAGFTEIVERTLEPGCVLDDHHHAWDARLMVTAGEVTLRRAGQAEHYAPGQWCEVPRDQVHAEVYGPQGCSLLIGRRYA